MPVLRWYISGRQLLLSYDNFINKVNVANEILQFRSKKLMREVVRRVHADVSYQVKDGLRYNELYSRSPVAVAFPDVLPGRSFAFTVTPKDSTTVAITDWKGIDEERAYTVKLNDTLMVGNERIVVTATNYYGASWANVPVRVEKMPLDAMVGYYLGNIGIRQEEDESSILTLSLKDSSPARAEDMLIDYHRERIGRRRVRPGGFQTGKSDCRYFFRSGNVYERIAEIQFRCHGIGNPVAACQLY